MTETNNLSLRLHNWTVMAEYPQPSLDLGRLVVLLCSCRLLLLRCRIINLITWKSTHEPGTVTRWAEIEMKGCAEAEQRYAHLRVGSSKRPGYEVHGFSHK